VTSDPTVDLDLDLDFTARSRLAGQDRSTSNVEGGVSVVRRRQPRRSGSTIKVNVDDHERHIADL